jgi:Holliday junction DNA helicase RuvA
MFGKLQGAIDYVGANFVVMMAGGVGFRILLPANILARQRVGENATFWIETIVRDDSISLVGFESMAEQDMFVKLLSVSGIGTKVALAILGAFKISVLQGAVASGDVKTLTSVPGVGKRVAERIIVELKGKSPAFAEGADENDVYGDTLTALEALGYRRADCVEFVQKLAKENPDDDVQSLLTKVLKEFAGGRK